MFNLFIISNIMNNNKNDSEPKKAKKVKCSMCKKKLGLMPFECKCGLMFCALHRAPECHNCTFDYKSEGCKKLEERLVKVVNEKVAVI